MTHLLVCAMALLFAIELSEDEIAKTEEYRKQKVSGLSTELRGLQKDMKSAKASKDPARVASVKNEIGWRVKARNQAKLATAEELFEEMRRKELKGAAELLAKERQAQREKEMETAGPVTILGMGINTNIIGLPEIVLEVKNNTGKTVEAIEFEADCFNKFDEPVLKLVGDNRFSAHWKYEIEPQATQRIRAQMSLQRSTAKADVWISRVKLNDGQVWTQTKEEAQKKPYGMAKARLME